MKLNNIVITNHKQLIIVLSLIALYSIATPASVHAERHAENQRHIELEGQSNFRDIGGYRTVDRQSVKWGTIYRSGELSRLSDDDVRKLEELEIKTVFNFLSKDEIDARGHDRLPDGVNELLYPISGEAENDLALIVLEARQTADFSKVPVELNTDVHRILVGDAAREQYADLIRKASDTSNHPLVYHCSHGVHRTGTATAILLSALGVPWETIRYDYLLSNEYRKDEVKIRLSELQRMAAAEQNIHPDEVDMTNINAFYILEASYIDAAFDEIIKDFGSMENYLHEGLGLTDEELLKFREALLE